MPRTARAAVRGLCYHVINRGNARGEVFHKPEDYGAYILVRRKGYGVVEVATQLRRDVTTLSVLLSRFTDRLHRDPALQQGMEQVTGEKGGCLTLCE